MPDNSAYMIAAYVVAGVVYLFYAGRLMAKAFGALKD